MSIHASSFAKAAISLLPAAGVAVVSLVAVAMVAFQPGAPGDPVAVFFRPSDGGDAALLRVASAGGEILRHGGIDLVVIARSDVPGFADRLYGHGAIFVSTALGRWICSPSRSGET